MNSNDAPKNGRGFHKLHLVTALLLGAVSICWTRAQTIEPAALQLDGTLFGTLFGRLGESAILKTEGMAEPLRIRIISFQKRAQAFRSRLPALPSTPGPKRYIEEKRRQLEGGIVALISDPDIERLASDYAAKATLYYEWEGMSESPMAEAAYAEEYLRKNPQTPIRPFLHLFLAHRYRCAFEALALRKTAIAGGPVFRSFHGSLTSALKDPDSLVQFIAEDIGRQPYLYLKPRSGPSVDPTLGDPGRPALPIQEAADLADRYAKEHHIDLSAQYIHSITFRFDDKSDHGRFYWHVQWMWSKPRMGGEYGLKVYMDGHIAEARLGP